MKTYLFWANVRAFNNHGYGRQSAGFMQVQVRAPNNWQAKQMLVAQYGAENVISEANIISGSEQGGW